MKRLSNVRVISSEQGRILVLEWVEWRVVMNVLMKV